MKKVFLGVISLLILITIVACDIDIKKRTSPTITGVNTSLELTIGSLYDPLLGVLASDEVDGDITSKLVHDFNDAWLNQVGNYTYTVSVVNTANLKTAIKVALKVVAESSEKPVTPEDVAIDIYYLNDLHGAIEEGGNSLGLSKIANYLNQKRKENPYTILIAGGDMFQGTALSNYYHGLSTLNIMNEMKFDLMVTGNHEFDWGLPTVMNYFDHNLENGEANFPILGANIFKKDTKKMVDNMKPYEIIELSEYKIGIIGTIGYGLENSIATAMASDYQFGMPQNEIKKYAKILREEEDCDLVISVSHDGGSYTNNLIANYLGNERIDAIFNAHTHQEYVDTINHIPVIQSGSSGYYIGHLNYKIDQEGVSLMVSENILNLNPSQDDPDVLALINEYLEETSVIFNTPIIKSGEYLSRGLLTDFAAKLMVYYTNSDIGFHNYGGTRVAIPKDINITYGVLYEAFPFDNVVKTVYLKGKEIKDFMSFSSDASNYYSRHSSFADNTLYKVVTNDYIFDKVDYPFINGEDPYFDGTILRELIRDELVLQKDAGYSLFKVTNDIQMVAINNLTFTPHFSIFKAEEDYYDSRKSKESRR